LCSLQHDIEVQQGQSVEAPERPASRQIIASHRDWHRHNRCRVDGRSDDRDRAPVLRRAGSRRAVRDETLAPEGQDANALRRHTGLDEAAAHGLSPLLRDGEIMGEAAGVIGMTLDDYGEVGIAQEPGGLGLQRQPTPCAQLGTGIAEEDPVPDSTLKICGQAQWSSKICAFFSPR
jgi:hypothetical protein